jgi:hypothetical protein
MDKYKEILDWSKFYFPGFTLFETNMATGRAAWLSFVLRVKNTSLEHQYHSLELWIRLSPDSRIVQAQVMSYVTNLVKLGKVDEATFTQKKV